MRLLEFIAVLTVICLLSSCVTRQPTQSQSTAPSAAATIMFVNANLTGSVAKTQLATWWSTKLKIGSDEPDAYNFLVSTNDHDKHIRVENCQQYTNALSQGAYALTTADMATDSWFVRAGVVLRFMETAQPSQHPLPDDFLIELPISFLGWSGSDEEAQISKDTIGGLTLKNYARSGKLKQFKQGNHTLHFQTARKNFSVEELARGDSGGDGFEDALIFVTWHYREGSGFGFEVYVAARSTTGTNFALAPTSLRE